MMRVKKMLGQKFKFRNFYRFTVVAVLLLLSACTSQVTLFNKMTEQDANEVYSELIRNGFAVTKISSDKGYTIQVPSSMAGEAFALLSSKGLPKDHKSSIKDLFPDDSVMSSPLQEKARYIYALSQGLEKTLMTVDGVLSARVHIVLPDQAQGTDSLTPSKVAVFVKYAKDSPFPAYVSQIRKLVLSSIPTMSEEDARNNVTIVSIPAETEIKDPLTLVWFGPLAIKGSDRYYLIGLIYFFVALWVFSLAVLYLITVEPARRPAFLNSFLNRSDKEDDLEEMAKEVANEQ